jgi:hypothetical protein
MVDVNHSQQHGKKKVGCLILQSPHILGPQTFTKRMMRCSRCYLKIWCFTFAQAVLQKTKKSNLKGGKNGRRLALKMGCDLENLKPLSKLDLHLKSSCLKRPWILNKASSLVMKGKRLSLYN